MSQKVAQRSQLLGGQMNDPISAQESTIGPEPESCKGML
jgi:hypothetical protein